MTTNDQTQSSVAAALVAANLSFTSTVETTPHGQPGRIFRVPYQVGDHETGLVAYIGGTVLTVLAAIRVDVPTGATIEAKRYALADFLMSNGPFVRVRPNPFPEPKEDRNVLWVEVSIPAPSNGEPMEYSLVQVPFVGVVTALHLLAEKFTDVKPSVASSFPIMTAASRSSVAPASK